MQHINESGVLNKMGINDLIFKTSFVRLNYECNFLYSSVAQCLHLLIVYELVVL